MKRFLTFLLAGLFAIALAGRAEAGFYWFGVKDETGAQVTTGFTCQIYTVASSAPDALFSDTGYGTKVTNPVNPDGNGVIKFATSNSTVDVACFGSSGNVLGSTAFRNSMTDKDHSLVFNTQQIIKHVRFFWDRDISKGAEIDTGIDLPIGALVDDVYVEVATARARMSVSVGLLSTEASGTTSGFCVSAAADEIKGGAEWFRCEASRRQFDQLLLPGAGTGTASAAEFGYVSNTRGQLLASFTLGGRIQLNLPFASYGRYAEYPHVVKPGAARSLVYQTSDQGAAAGWIHLFFRELRKR